MADIIKENGASEEELEEIDVVTLTDENGEELDFVVLGEAEIDGVVYMALEPVENPNEEFVILKQVAAEDGAIDLVSIEDDDEFERVSDFFEDELFGEIDYDVENSEK